eukprot:11188196-Lingulodinium_polyedra.AAC.1
MPQRRARNRGARTLPNTGATMANEELLAALDWNNEGQSIAPAHARRITRGAVARCTKLDGP